MALEPSGSSLAPVRKEVTVECDRATAFDLFTVGIDQWWPLPTHSITQGEAVRCEFEPRVGGGLFEVSSDGRRLSWGIVVEWEPPRRFLLEWNPNPSRIETTDVEVTFLDLGGRTTIVLEHTGWERLGEAGADLRHSYVSGWDPVLDDYKARVAS